MDKDYLEPKHGICRDSNKAKLSTGEGHGDVHDAFLACLGSEVKPRGGHADSVAKHTAKVAMPPMEDTGAYYYGEKSITVPVEPSPEDPFSVVGGS